MSANLRGGDKMKATIEELLQKAGNAQKVRVGFLEDAKYEDGTPVAYIAACNEFGAKIEAPEHEVEIYRSIDKKGDFNKKGHFVKKEKSNFATTHLVPAHEIVIPPRPFFRTMISNNKDGWGDVLGVALKKKKMDSDAALKIVGEVILGQLEDSILSFDDPPNAPSTIAKKGFDNPLIDKGIMQNTASYEVKE